MAEYKQGVLQRRAVRRLRAAKYRLTHIVQHPTPVHHYPMRHRMSPLESLRRFQIDCGELQQPAPPLNAAVLPTLPVEPKLTLISFAEAPPELPPPGQPVLTPEVPVLVNVPTTPVETVPTALPTPEPASFALMLTGAILGAESIRRKRASAANS